MEDPHLQVRGGGGHPDPEIRVGWGVLKKNFFSAFRASVWSKNKGAPRASALDPLLVCH